MPAFPRLRFRSRGFTLIELLVVIVILGILMAVAVPTFLRQQSKAQDSRTQQYLTTAFKAIRASTPDTNNAYPSSTSMVSWVQQSEPELTAQRGSCTSAVSSAPQDAVLVDPSSTSNALTLCARSQSGNVWKLTASATGVQQLLDGTLVPLTISGNEITDANRAAQGDGLSNDSSTGIWESTTNLIPNGGLESAATDTAGWLVNAGTLARDSSTAKFGSFSLKGTATSTGALTLYGRNLNTSTIAATAGNTYTASVWIHNPTRQAQVGLFFQDASSNQLGGSWESVQSTSNGWVYHSVTVVAPATTTMMEMRVQFLGGNVGDTENIDGAQIEQKAIPTPYVDTSNGTASRGSSVITAPANLVTSTQGWTAIRVRMPFSSTQDFGLGGGFRQPNLFSFTDGTLANRVHIFWYSGTQAWNLIVNRGATSGGSSVQIAPASGNTFSAGAVLTVIGKWTATNAGISVNGAAFTTGSVGITSWPSSGVTLTVGGFHSQDGYQADADILWCATGTGTLSDADAATISGFGNTDPKVSQFPSSAQTSMVWNGVSSSGSLK